MRRLINLGTKTFCCTALAFAVLAPSIVDAHHPDRETQPVHPRVDVIGPVGNRLPASYRRTYNRPTYIGGKIAYWIAPSSQEAMAWHRAEHLGLYKNHSPRVENHYFYPKPWEALRVGQRLSVLPSEKKATTAYEAPVNTLSDEGLISPVYSEPIPPKSQTIESINLPTDPLEFEPVYK